MLRRRAGRAGRGRQRHQPRTPPRWSSSTYDPLPAVLDPCAGLAPGAPKARLDCPDNLVAHWAVKYGDVERTFAGAAHRMSEHFRMHKGGGHSIEARGVVARFDAADELLTVWDSTQMPHKAKRVLVDALGLSEDQVRVIAPDVGGGFGPKNPFYPEELAMPAAALAAGPSDQMDRGPPREFHRHQSRARAGLGGRSGGRRATASCSRSAAISATTTAPPRRPGLSLPQNATTNLLGPYVLPALPARRLALPHQHGGGDLDPRRRPAAGHLRDGAAARPHRRRARPRRATRCAAAI